MELSRKQKEIVESPNNKIVVVASAAAGKTRILTERVKFLIKNGANPSGIAVITFTVAAADEMRSRIGNYPELFIGTIHGLLYKWICEAGYNKDAEALIEKERFDDFFKFVQMHPECIHHLENLILDEAQDTDDQMWEVLLYEINPTNFFIVGDHRQVIYDTFRNVDPKRLLQLTYLKGVVTYELDENYRNGSNILSFAKRILRPLDGEYVDESVPMQEIPGQVDEEPYSIESVINYCKNIRSEDYDKWFILCRTNSEVGDVIFELQKNGIPCSKLIRSGMSAEELQKQLNENCITVGTIHSAKGLEKDNVMVIDPRFYNEPERRVSYVAATRAIKKLIWMPIKKSYKKRLG